jgi:hypothetical protein
MGYVLDPDAGLIAYLIALDFVGFPIVNQRDHIWPDESGVDMNEAAIQFALPLFPIAFQRQEVACSVEIDVVSHLLGKACWGALSIASLLAAFFQRDSDEGTFAPVVLRQEVRLALLPHRFSSKTANNPAAMTARSACLSFETAGAATSLSRNPVSILPARKSGSANIRLNNETLVWMPPTNISLTARSERDTASSLLSP